MAGPAPTLGGFLMLAAAALCSCGRGSEPCLSPSLQSGDLAISEIRGKQQGMDTFGEWIELFNTTTAPIDLYGLAIDLVRLDGTGYYRIFVRQHVSVEGGGYFVIGRWQPASVPAWGDYGFELDFGSDLYVDGLIQLISCHLPVNQAIDLLAYYGLPGGGTLAFDGAKELTGTSNDASANWCVDDVPGTLPNGGDNQQGIPGTPGEKNRSCP
jgi:hypothetical protein